MGALIVVATFAAYIPAMRAGFVYDDGPLLTDNPFIKAPDGLYRFWFTTEPPDYFPMTWTLLWLEWRLWGMHPAGYHVVNILLHAVGAVLIWRVLERLHIPAAWVAAMIFAVHPVNVESVAWVVQRKNVLPMVFYALTLLWYVRFQSDRRWRWYALSIGAFLLALLAKTAVVMTPFVLLLCGWWLRGRVSRRDVLESVPFFILGATFSLVGVWFQYNRVIGSDYHMVRDDSFLSRLAGAGWAVWFYLYKAFLPYKLSFVYPRWSIDPSRPLSYVPGLVLVGVFAVLWWYRAGWARPGLFALGYYVLMLFPVLGFFNISYMRYSLVADHWQYFSIIGVATFVAGVFGYAHRRWSTGRRGLPVVMAAVVCLLSVLTWRQARLYKDENTLWRDALAKTPNSLLVHWSMGNLLFKEGKHAEAVAHYTEALRIRPDDAEVRCTLANALAEQGKTDQAISEYQEALRIKPDFAEAYVNLGSVLASQGRTDEAIAYYQEALRIKPDLAEAHVNLGNAWVARGEMDQAIVHYREALRLQPGRMHAPYGLGLAFHAVGDLSQARRYLERAVELDPNLVLAHLTLGQVCLKQGDTSRAVVHLRRAVTLDPSETQALRFLGRAELAEGRSAEGLEHLRRAVELEPKSAGLHAELGMAFLRLGRPADAVKALRASVSLDRGSTEVVNNLAWVLATCPDPSVRNSTEALELAIDICTETGHRKPELLDTLAAAYAAAGQFERAATTARQAAELASHSGEHALAAKIEERLRLYASGRPFYEAAP